MYSLFDVYCFKYKTSLFGILIYYNLHFVLVSTRSTTRLATSMGYKIRKLHSNFKMYIQSNLTIYTTNTLTIFME